VQKVLGCFQERLAYSEEPMEDLAGEKVRDKNLNNSAYWESAYGKKKPYKAHGDFHFRGDIKIAGQRDAMQKCKECERFLFSTAFTSSYTRSDGAYLIKKICRECCTVLEAEKRAARKNAPPKSDDCDNCHEKKNLWVDHTHGTTNVRGWLCAKCNSGIGGLGDDLEGVLRAAIYLEKDKSKIIKKLNDLE